MSRVFVVQNHVRFDGATQRLLPKYDISSAAKYGEIVYVLPPRASVACPDEVIATIAKSLADFGPDDYLLPIGHPCFIGWATAIAASRLSRAPSGYPTLPLRTLIWVNGAYSVISVSLPVRAG